MKWHITPVGQKLGITDEVLAQVLPKKFSTQTFMEACDILTVRELSNLIVCARMISEISPAWQSTQAGGRRLFALELPTPEGIHVVLFVVEPNQTGLVAVSREPLLPLRKAEQLSLERGSGILKSLMEYTADQEDIPWNSNQGPSGLVM